MVNKKKEKSEEIRTKLWIKIDKRIPYKEGKYFLTEIEEAKDIKIRQMKENKEICWKTKIDRK